MMYKNLHKFGTLTDKILYTLWRFRFLSIDQFSYLININTSDLKTNLKSLEKEKYIKSEFVDGRKYYLITRSGSKKIDAKHINSKASFALSVHNTGLYRLIKNQNWSNYLSEREFLMEVINNYKKSRPLGTKSKNSLLEFRKNGTIPDLILFEKNKRIAIEYERSRKSPEKYETIFECHKNNIHKFKYYDKVRYYCSKEAYTLLTRLLDKLYSIDFTIGVWKEMSDSARKKFMKTNQNDDITLVLIDEGMKNG